MEIKLEKNSSEAKQILKFKRNFNGGLIGDFFYSILDRLCFKKMKRDSEQTLNIIIKSRLAKDKEDAKKVLDKLISNIYHISGKEDYEFHLANTGRINVNNPDDYTMALYEFRVLRY